MVVIKFVFVVNIHSVTNLFIFEKRHSITLCIKYIMLLNSKENQLNKFEFISVKTILVYTYYFFLCVMYT